GGGSRRGRGRRGVFELFNLVLEGVGGILNGFTGLAGFFGSGVLRLFSRVFGLVYGVLGGVLDGVSGFSALLFDFRRFFLGGFFVVLSFFLYLFSRAVCRFVGGGFFTGGKAKGADCGEGKKMRFDLHKHGVEEAILKRLGSFCKR